MSSPMANSSSHFQCHYEVLQIPQDADAATIKKAHRRLAIKYHPDKNDSEEAHSQFQLIQQAYECLSDEQERQWYDQHRDAILKGWTSHNNSNDQVQMLFDVIPYQHPSCYNGYGNDQHGFYSVYRHVFQQIYQGEQEGWMSEGNLADDMPLFGIPTDFGSEASEWTHVKEFYVAWESFASCLSFAWADVYMYQDIKEAPHRRIRRAMEEENKKKRKAARKERNQDVLALVHFVKRRDPRVKAQQERIRQQQAEKKAEEKEEAERKKIQTQQAREEWRAEAEKAMAELEEEDRLAGRVRLADLEDDYDYDGGGKRGRKGKKKNRNRNFLTSEEDQQKEMEDGNQDDKVTTTTTLDQGECDESNEIARERSDITDEASSEMGKLVAGEQSSDDGHCSISSEQESESSSEPEVWKCECCRKDFKSQGQMESHLRSKKHKEAWKKYEKRLQQSQMEDLLDELALDS